MKKQNNMPHNDNAPTQDVRALKSGIELAGATRVDSNFPLYSHRCQQIPLKHPTGAGLILLPGKMGVFMRGALITPLERITIGLTVWWGYSDTTNTRSMLMRLVFTLMGRGWLAHSKAWSS